MKVDIGGQAVIEGVMLKTKSKIAIAVRKSKGRISVKKQKCKSLTEQHKVFGLPFVRGIIILFEMMFIGIKALNYSANEALEEEEEKLGTGSLILTIIFSLLIALLIFKFLPLLITQFISSRIQIFENRIIFNFTDAIIKICFFLVYVKAISMMDDIKQIFQYHGAEHMVVHCYEANEKITPANCLKHSRLHARCGTSFVMYVIIISIIVYSLMPNDIGFFLKFGLRVALLPVIVGLSYEILKISNKFKNNKIFSFMTKPGIWLQNLTTAQPDKKQIEVAIKALNALVKI